LLDREDLRKVLAGSVVVLASGIMFATLSTGIPGAFIAVWLLAAGGRTVYGIVGVRQLAEDGRRSTNQPGLVPRHLPGSCGASATDMLAPG
jgi:hypothetical protein